MSAQLRVFDYDIQTRKLNAPELSRDTSYCFDMRQKVMNVFDVMLN